MVYKDSKNLWVTWASVPGAPFEEVRVAHTILTPSCKGIPVRVMNLARYPITLRHGMVLRELEPIEVVKNRPGEAKGPEIDVKSDLPIYVQTLLDIIRRSASVRPVRGPAKVDEVISEVCPCFLTG